MELQHNNPFFILTKSFYVFFCSIFCTICLRFSNIMLLQMLIMFSTFFFTPQIYFSAKCVILYNTLIRFFIWNIWVMSILTLFLLRSWLKVKSIAIKISLIANKKPPQNVIPVLPCPLLEIRKPFILFKLLSVRKADYYKIRSDWLTFLVYLTYFLLVFIIHNFCLIDLLLYYYIQLVGYLY